MSQEANKLTNKKINMTKLPYASLTSINPQRKNVTRCTNLPFRGRPSGHSMIAFVDLQYKRVILPTMKREIIKVNEHAINLILVDRRNYFSSQIKEATV